MTTTEQEVVNTAEFFELLQCRAAEISAKHSPIEVLTRTREGLRKPHGQNILTLFWWYLYTTDIPLYKRLRSTVDEAEIRQILGGKVMTSFVQGEKTIAVCSDLFPPDFLRIIEAYLEYTDTRAE